MVAVPGAAAAAAATTVLADPRSNSLIVRAPQPGPLAVVRPPSPSWTGRRRPAARGGGMWVVHLKNADAVRLATVLRAAFPAAGGSGGGGGGSRVAVAGDPRPPSPGRPGSATPGKHGQRRSPRRRSPSAQPSTGGFIQADPATNSLIITAPSRCTARCAAMIDQLDSAARRSTSRA
jgi:general secretion pathway protein D